MKKITFKPLKRGKFRCFVDGKITDIITRNCKAVCNRFHNQNRQPFREEIWSVMATWDNDWDCPHCGRTNHDGYTGQRKKCWRCDKVVKIIGERSRPEPNYRRSFLFGY